MRSSGSMRILGTNDAAEWRAVLGRSRQHDFHQLPQYHRVAEQRGEGVAQLFVYREDECTIALPLLLRPIDPANPGGWHDATSVYGYGGPVASHGMLPTSAVRNFQTALADELNRRRVVAVFSRLHPLIAQDQILAGLGECPANGQTISIDLAVPDDAQRAKYSKSCRTSVRKLHEHGFAGFHDREKRYLPEFVSVYLETMRRAAAQSSYFFDEAYFNLLTRELDGVAHLFVVLKEGEVAAATLCTICDGIVQDHLGGTRDIFLKFSPDRLLVDTERRWAAEMGARVLHLGGGVGAQQDSVFRYKAGFSDLRHTFRTWRWIIRPEVYEELFARATRRNAASGLRAVSAGYFPGYRCPTTPAADEIPVETAGQVEGRSEAAKIPQTAAIRVLRTSQSEEWMSALRGTSHHDFYFLPGYHALAEERGEGEARLFVYERDGYLLALPLMLRSIADVPEPGTAAGTWRDATSVYGYAGLLVSHEQVPDLVLRGFQTALSESLRELRVVSAFSRLHPLLPQHGLLDGLGECRPGGQTVSIDLTLPLEAQRAQYRSATKTRLNRLVRAGVTCKIDPQKRHLREFVSIYHETMRRVGAQDIYFFDDEYFSGLVESLGSALHLFVAMLPDGEVAAGGLFTLCDGVVQYHLGGTRDAALKLSPMALIVDAARLWAHQQQARVLHLGGGVGAKADSLFHFKAGFSGCRHEFATWRWIIMPEVYRALAEQRRRWNAERGLEPIAPEYFPAYRCPARPHLPARPADLGSNAGLMAQEPALAAEHG